MKKERGKERLLGRRGCGVDAGDRCGVGAGDWCGVDAGDWCGVCVGDPVLWRLRKEDCFFTHRLALTCDLPQEASGWSYNLPNTCKALDLNYNIGWREADPGFLVRGQAGKELGSQDGGIGQWVEASLLSTLVRTSPLLLTFPSFPVPRNRNTQPAEIPAVTV